MVREIRIVDKPILESELLSGRQFSTASGAVITFLGVVRSKEGSEEIEAIRYEAYHSMAMHQFHKILDQVQSQWPIESIRLIHRIGVVPIGEPSLWVEVLAPHRGEAFAACQHIIDVMKQVVPIWKHPIASGLRKSSTQ